MSVEARSLPTPELTAESPESLATLDLFALDRMFACILIIMLIAVVFTEGLRWAERTAFPWRVGQ